MERVKPIYELNLELLAQGIFLLVDMDTRTLRFFGYNQAAVNRAADDLKGRQDEMVKFLIARARARGETT